MLFLAVFFYTNPVLTDPDLVTIKSALIWRQDNQGDYIFDKPPGPGVYEISPTHTTEGTIESITASWRFRGEVMLEVSADNGLHYTPIINGVPLTSGFVKGNNLKWRVTVGPYSDVTEVKIAYTDSLGVVGSFGEPRLSGFSKRKQLSIINNGENDLFNYQMIVRVAESFGAGEYDIHCSGGIELDFEDVRFTCSDGQTIIPHYLEKMEGEAPYRIATFWIKVPQIPREGLDIYLYYGNVLAEDISSAEATFDFYDDFNEEGLDLEKWQVKEGLYGVSDSQLILDAAEIIAKDFVMADGIIEYRAHAVSGDEVRVILRSQPEDLLSVANQTAYSSGFDGVEHCIAVGEIVKVNTKKPITSNVSYDYRVILDGTSITFQRFAANFAELQAEVQYDDVQGLPSGDIRLKTGSGCKTKFDWIRVRSYSADVIEVDSEQARYASAEEVGPAEFEGVGLTGSDNLILEDEFDEGTYTSQTFPLDTNVRIFIPYWKSLQLDEEQLSVDISVDGGYDFREDVVGGAHYYTSRGDFISGDDLRFKVEFLRREGISAQFEELQLDYGPGKILVVTPNGGEAWQAGTQKSIEWTALGYDPAYPMKLEYSLDGGRSYKVISEKTANSGAYLWNIPQDIDCEEAMVRISDALEARVYDTSDDVFSIKAEEVEVVEEEPVVVPEIVPEEEPKAEEKPKEKPKEKPDELEKLIESKKPSGTKTYDVMIKIGDNHHRDPEEDARACLKHGDVVLVRPAGHIWSETERNSYLIIQLNLTEEQVRNLTQAKKVDTGKLSPSGRPIMKTLKARVKRINLAKLGLDKQNISKVEQRKQGLERVRKSIKNRALKNELIEDK